MKKNALFLIFCFYLLSPVIAQDTELVLKMAFPDPDSTIPDDYLIHPYDLVIFDDYFVVCDARDNCLKVFSKSGEFIRKIGRSGQGPGEINTVFRITSDKKNKIIFCNDQGNGRITSFDENGKFKSIIRTKLPPYDIEYIDGIMHTLEYNRVKESLFSMYDSAGVLIKTYGEIFDDNIPEDRFSSSLYTRVNLDSDINHFYVLYSYIPLIGIYSHKGELIRRQSIDVEEIKENYKENIRGVKQGLVNKSLKIRPWHNGGCVNDNHFYYLTNFILDEILKIDSNGKFRKKIPFKKRENNPSLRFITLLNKEYIFIDLDTAQVKIYEEVISQLDMSKLKLN